MKKGHTTHSYPDSKMFPNPFVKRNRKRVRRQATQASPNMVKVEDELRKGRRHRSSLNRVWAKQHYTRSKRYGRKQIEQELQEYYKKDSPYLVDLSNLNIEGLEKVPMSNGEMYDEHDFEEGSTYLLVPKDYEQGDIVRYFSACYLGVFSHFIGGIECGHVTGEFTEAYRAEDEPKEEYQFYMCSIDNCITAYKVMDGY